MFLALFGIVLVSVYFTSYTINLLESVFLPWEFHRRAFRSPCFPFCVKRGGAFCTAVFASDSLRRAPTSLCITCESLWRGGDVMIRRRTNQTTHEEIALPPHLTVKTESRLQEVLPVLSSWRENLKYVLFSPIMPSLTALQYV